MSTKIGPFEILSELAKSSTGAVYKANDPESAQTVALKAIQLSAFGEAAADLQAALLAEAEKTKVLSSSNITPVFGAGEIDGLFCAAMEYVQGNSIATMLARKEGFSIWDLLDIGRQLCGGLDHAASHNVVHYSLEPAKIMCGWDGTVKILSYGLSSVGNFLQHVTEGLPPVLHYMSPEQMQGQPADARSNLFSLGAIFYEMVTEHKAFDGDGIESLRQCVVQSTPVPPIQLNAKVNPLLSDLIMKTLAKDPAQRYASGRALLDDLEKCKESRPSAAKKAEGPKAPAAPQNMKAAGLPKPSASAAQSAPRTVPASAPGFAKSASTARPEANSAVAKPASASSPARNAAVPARTEASPATLKSRAAAAGSNASPSSQIQPEFSTSSSLSTDPMMGAAEPSSYMSSAAVDEPEIETFEPQADQPKIAVDPMMAGGAQTGGGTSFSEISELPPLKEVYIPPPPPPPPPVFEPEPAAPVMPKTFARSTTREEKPKVQTREVAEKAIKEIKSVPPKLMFYALGAAAALILVIGIGITIYIHQQNSDDDATAGRAATVTEAPAQPTETQNPAEAQPAPQQSVAPAPSPAEEPAEPETSARSSRSARAREARRRATPAAPVIIPGQLALDSTPQGAQVQVDGRTDASYVTPFALTNLAPGQHTISVSKAGYNADTRSVNIISGSRATVVVHLSQLVATLVVNSNPSGANIYIDGRDSGTRTPGQVSVNKGQHVVLVRKMGYIDETMSAQFVLGQTFNFAPTLRPLGNVDDIRTVGKMSRLFGGKAQAGQSIVSIRTQPKGAQVAINEHIMDKNTPLEVALDPGNYVIDITMTGYAPVHKVITTDRGGKVVVDETLQTQ